MPFYVFFIILFSFFSSYASEFFNPNKYAYKTYNYYDALDYHFSSANIAAYNISSYKEYENALAGNSSLNLTFDFINTSFSIGDNNYMALLLIGTSNDSMMRPDGAGAGYITIWVQNGDKYSLVASNEIYAIYGASISFNDESNTLEIDSPMGQCEILFLKTSLLFSTNKVFYNNVIMTMITAENTMKDEVLYDRNSSDKKYLLNNKNGLDFLY